MLGACFCALGIAFFAMSLVEPVFRNDYSRRILHVDMDAFFASVEQRDHPELRGRPIAVGHADRRGVVATASYEARRFGVHSAMPSARAKMLCPELIFVECRMMHYREISEAIREIFSRYTNLVEPMSVDEAYLDVTYNKQGLMYGVEVARRIKYDIERELSLTASAGVSFNKFLAKVASDWRKPNGLFTIRPERAQDFIDALPIEAFWGVGPVTAKRFHEMGVRNGWELRLMSFSQLTDAFGVAGAEFYKFARGIDPRPVRATRERKSVGCEETYPEDITHPGELRARIGALSEDLFGRMQKRDFKGRTLTLKVRFSDFTTKTRSLTRPQNMHTLAEIEDAALELLQSVEIPPGGVRLLGLSVSQPDVLEDRQGTLF